MKDLISSQEYDFLRTHPAIKDRILFLTYGGSVAYGTNNEHSDIDIRGVCMNRVEDLLGYAEHHEFEQLIDRDTDTVVYSFNKMVRLLCDNNPNSLEILFNAPDAYYFVHEFGQMLLDNRTAFLSQRATKSFAGYARQQLARLENALARDRLPQSKKEQHIMNACLSTIDGFEKRYSTDMSRQIEIYLIDSEKEELEKEAMVNICAKGVPLRELASMAADLANVAHCYEKVNHRNKKKDDRHLNKHAMHLVRLYIMGIEILSTGTTKTNRKEDLPILLPILDGKYMKADGTYEDEFFEMVAEYEKQMQYAAKHTVLPEKPNFEVIKAMTADVNRRTIIGDI